MRSARLSELTRASTLLLFTLYLRSADPRLMLGMGVVIGLGLLTKSSASLWVLSGGLLIVLNAWGAGPGHPADLSGDGVVGFDDLLIVLSAWTPM